MPDCCWEGKLNSKMGQQSNSFLAPSGRRVDTNTPEMLAGILAMLLERLRITQAMKTERYASYALGIGDLLLKLEGSRLWGDAPYDSLTILLLSRWPVFNLMCSTAFQAQAMRDDQMSYGYQHKPYDLDFLPSEIIRSPAERAQLTMLHSLPNSAHIDYLRAARRGRISRTYRALLAALETALGADIKPTMFAEKVVLVTLIWGSRLSGYLRGSLQRASAFGLGHCSLVFCLDEASCDICREVHPYRANCVQGRLKTIYNKYTVLSAVVNLGFNALYLDFDTVLLQDPLPPVIAASQEAEVLVSRDFGSECLNTGVIYFKAHEDTAALVALLLVWLWHHPYEFSQKAFSAFLGVENVSEVPAWLPLGKLPTWSTLEYLNQFVTSTVYNPEVEGWTGNIDDIVIYHFLDGTGGVDTSRAVAGQYINLYDLFFSNPSLDLGDPSRPLWEQDQRVEAALLRSRQPSPPKKLYPCMLYPDTA